MTRNRTLWRDTGKGLVTAEAEMGEGGYRPWETQRYMELLEATKRQGRIPTISPTQNQPPFAKDKVAGRTNSSSSLR